MLCTPQQYPQFVIRLASVGHFATVVPTSGSRCVADSTSGTPSLIERLLLCVIAAGRACWVAYPVFLPRCVSRCVIAPAVGVEVRSEAHFHSYILGS